MINKIVFTLLLSLCSLQTIRLFAENYPYRSDVLWVTTPNHNNWIYKSGEDASVEVQFYKYGIPCDAVVEYEIGEDMLTPIKKSTLKLKEGRGKILLGTMDKPGFLDCNLKTNIDGKVYKHHIKVGFSPELIKPYTKDPSDFDQFWSDNISKAKKFPLTYICKKVDAYSSSEIDCYLVKIQLNSRGKCIYGYLTKPTVKGKYPVVLTPPGAGVKTIKEPLKHLYYAKNGFIRFEIEIHGLNPEFTPEEFAEISNSLNYGENGYLANGLDNRDNYYMKHVYEACVRCIDFLTSLDEWDGKNVIVQGGSQGGALSLITAGLDNRVTQCIVNHPALSDMAGYLYGTGGYPHFHKMNNMLTPDKVNTMAYYDVVNFAKRVECSVYMTWGFNDNTCPPTTSYAVYNLIKSDKEALITPINEHWTSENTEYRQLEWIKRHLK